MKNVQPYISHLVELGLMASWLAGWQVDEIHVKFKILKLTVDQNCQFIDIV